MRPKEGWDISLAKKVNIVLLLIGFISFLIVAYLYNVESEFVFYVLSIWGLLVLCGVAICIWGERKKSTFINKQIALNADTEPEECKEIIRLLETHGEYIDSDYIELIKAIQGIYEAQNVRFREEYHAKQEFFGMWAHQIKTPIAALQLLLQSGELIDASECRQELFKIDNYVAMALNYLRFDSMSNDLEFAQYSLDELIRQILKKYASVFIHRHIGVERKNLDKRVLSDEKWLGVALEQVISNALKYTEEGSISIEAYSIANAVELRITDTGIGIRQEDLPRIFEKGFTGYNGRIDKKASGLGLYLCKGILDKLGHEISITSEEGIGTTVTVIFRREETFERNLTKM